MNNNITKSSEKSLKPAFPIVGIGASAGGLEAMEQFFSNVPANSGIAFVVIQHLDPDHECALPELLQRVTPMKVVQVTDHQKMKPDWVYIIPPGKSMSMLNGALHLFVPTESRGLRLPVDIFFCSMADDLNEKSTGIILSGMGSDGSLGLKAIKEKNGAVLVQAPENAKFNSMPRSAIEAVVPDIIAPAAELPLKLITFLKIVRNSKLGLEISDKYLSNLEKIILLLREQTGHDFSQYKKNTLFRRIERRMGIHQIEKINTYVRLLQDNPKERDFLFKELLIGVTSFFRDTAVWDMLRDRIFPEIIKDNHENRMLRAWVAGCSTGEEAYSMAIIFKEALHKSRSKLNISLQIFASDIDGDSINKARKGHFSKSIAGDVSPARLKKYFTPENDGFRVVSAIREMIVFAPQNVIKDPPFTKLDLLSCRNMLIYMEPQLQTKLLELFNYSLRPDSFLVLGSAETIGNKIGGITEIDAKLKIYKRSPLVQQPISLKFPSLVVDRQTFTTTTKPNPIMVENIQTHTDQLLLQRFAPASVLVNEQGDIIYITGRTGKYLEPVSGKANWNIHAMAREGLREVLPGAFRKASLDYEPVLVRNLKIDTNGGTQLIDLTIQRIEKPDAIKGMILVVFADVRTIVDNDAVNPKTSKRKPTLKQAELEVELKRYREDLLSLREEMQTSQEELKLSNEELQSTNEELQSTNEELSTSKEEMQSLNEELQTVNIELQRKINDYAHAHDDMNNLLNSIEIATLFLDKDLNIRRFTDKLSNIIKLRITDVGRPFTDLVNDLQYPEIEKNARQVLLTLKSFETEITTKNARWFHIRIMPYRTIDDRIDGLVMTFTDVTEYKNLEMELLKVNKKLGGNTENPKDE